MYSCGLIESIFGYEWYVKLKPVENIPEFPKATVTGWEPVSRILTSGVKTSMTLPYKLLIK